jgi:glutaminyl-tRNA synthetase
MDETSFTSEEYRSFIEEYIEEDILRNPRVQTRFPPEPNGYLHIGHAKAICIDFGMALKYGGTCNLRFDDTNPTKEDVEYVDSIKEDVRWLGFEWDHIYYASDYFDKLYEYAVQLIRQGKAFVCDLTAEQIKEYRGTLKEPGQNSPYCDRPIEENLRLFEAMKNGEYPDGSKVLRARIDMASPNVNMRDPVMYRILKARHHRTGDKWCIYPMYDYAHPVSDAIEGVTHSLCTLEFEDHRPLYDWFIREIGFEEPPRQIEFARLNITRTIMSKRYLKRLVDDKYVSGWDDPRMPTLCGLRRRGYTPESIRSFCERIGVAKSNSEVEASFMEHCIRDDLNEKAPRVMAVLDPVKLVIDNYPEGKTELITAEFMPDKPEFGTRAMTFSREVYIEREDFMEDPPKKFFRLSPGNETRLKSAYIIKCEHVVKDDDGNITEIHCTYDPATRSANPNARSRARYTGSMRRPQNPLKCAYTIIYCLTTTAKRRTFPNV